MDAQILATDDQYVLNHCTKSLARDNTDPRHNFGQFAPDDPRGRICEPWRLPIVDSYGGTSVEESSGVNAVTFVYDGRGPTPPQTVSIIGTFATLYDPIPLEPVRFLGDDTGYYALTVAVPKGEVHTYKFVVDGRAGPDPINPQWVTLDDGTIWSRIFTHGCSQPITLERWEWVLLDRLCDHILPFRTHEAEGFLRRFYFDLDRQAKAQPYTYPYRLDQSVGVVNFIDKLLAREENHHLVDYKICLVLIDKVLRQRTPRVEPADLPREAFVRLYDEMGRKQNQVDGWDYGRYDNPPYFLQLVRRHTLTGAFAHPKYGGNTAAAAWAFLAERYVDDAGATLFNWRAAIEPPLGTSTTYRG